MVQKRYKNGRELNALSDTLFLAGLMLSVLFPSILFAAFGLVTFTLVFICSCLGVVLGLVLYVPKANSSRQKKRLRMLKTQHKEFFHQIRLNVVRLLDKGATHERFLPRSS